MKISISALSIAYGLTPEALRYYEEKGLLSPDRAASSGFRRFSIADVQRLGIIKSLQRQGFSLDEIKRILTKCALSDLIVMMDEKRAALREQIAQQNAVYERMTSGTDLLRDCRRLLMQPRLCMGCAAYLVDFDSVPALWTAVPKMPFLKDLIDALPLTNYCTTVPLALLVCQARQRFQVLHVDAFALGERVVAPDEDVRPCGKQLGKDKVRFAQRLSDDRLVERAQVDHAHFAAQVAHIHDRVIRLALAENKFIRLAALRAHQLDERAGREGIMLGGDGEALAARGVRDVFILDQRGLLNDLTRVAQKLRALLREQNPPAVAQKDGDARFLLQLAHGGGETGLGDKQRLCGLGDGAALGDLDDVFQLLKRHKKTFLGALPQTPPRTRSSSKRENWMTA